MKTIYNIYIIIILFFLLITPVSSNLQYEYVTQWGTEGTGGGQLIFPRCVATGEDNTIYVTDNQNHRIQVFDKKGFFIRMWGKRGNEDGEFQIPRGIAISPEGTVYVTDSYNHRIQVFTKDGIFIKKWGSEGHGLGEFNMPSGIAIAPNGNVYVTDSYNDRIQVFTKDGDYITKWGESGQSAGQFHTPIGIAVAYDGTVFIVDNNNHRIQAFTSDGTYIRQWGMMGSGLGQFDHPSYITISSEKILYITDTNNHRVQVYTSDGAFINNWGEPGDGVGKFCYPIGITVADDHDIYVVDSWNHRIQHFQTTRDQIAESNQIITEWKISEKTNIQHSFIEEILSLFDGSKRLRWAPSRHGHSTVALPDNSIVLIGGLGEKGDDLVWRSTNHGFTWTVQTNNIGWLERFFHSSVALPDGSIVLMGGIDDSLSARNDVWLSSDKGLSWVQMTSNAEWDERFFHTSVTLPDDSIVLMGGCDMFDHGASNKNDVWLSGDRGVTWTLQTSSAAWSPRSQHSSVALQDGSIVLMGGSDAKGMETNDVWLSRDKGSTWTLQTSGAAWSPRSGHSSVALQDGSIVLMGGYDANDVWLSRDKGSTWTLQTSSAAWPPGTRTSSVALQDGSIVLMESVRSPDFDLDVWISRDRGLTWRQVNTGWWIGENILIHVLILIMGFLLIIGISSGFLYKRRKNAMVIKKSELYVDAIPGGNKTTSAVKQLNETIRRDVIETKCPIADNRKVFHKTEFPCELQDNYTDISLIGEGGFAYVFRARRESDNKDVAVKIPINKDRLTGKNIQNELKYWTDLNHDNICRVLSSDIFPIPHFELELCDNSLDALEKPISPKDSAWILLQICNGLGYAHEKSIIHGDLKPHNILLKGTIPKITDWGLARNIKASSSPLPQGMGSSHYMAPEIITGTSTSSTVQTDIWQVGVILYELLTGKVPFSGDSDKEIWDNIRTMDPQPPSAFIKDAEPLDAVVLKCLAKPINDRYQSVFELQKELGAYLDVRIEMPEDTTKSRKGISNSANYATELLKVHLENGDLQSAHIFALALIQYSGEEIQERAKKLAEGIESRIKNNITVPPKELIGEANIIINKLRAEKNS